MPRKRMIDPGIWDSVQAMSLTPAQFKTYIYLISCADDEGRLKYTPSMYKARIYPFNGPTQEEFDKDMARLEEIGLVVRYEVDGTEYLYHPNWNRYQKINRPTPSYFPPPPDGMSTHGVLTEDSRLIEENRKEENRNTTAMSAHALKKPYAENVLLTVEEYERLCKNYGGEMADKLVATLNSAKAAKGYKYKSDYHAILNWVVEKCGAVPRAKPPPKGWECPHCKVVNTHTGSVCLACKRDRDEEVP